MNPIDRPRHVSQQGRNALEDLSLADHNNGADSPGPTAVHVEAVMAS